MSLNLLNGKIRVYNFQDNPCGFASEVIKEGVFFKGKEEDEEFVMERVLWEDVQSENNKKGDIFKIGRLRFAPEEEDEIYSKLGITDKENIRNDRELMELLRDDSVSNLRYIMKIKSTLLISRMRNILFQMERGGKQSPHYVVLAVTEKSEELKGSPKNINSQIYKMFEQEKQDDEDSKLKDTLNDLKKEMSNLKNDNIQKEKESKESQGALSDLLKMVEQLKLENSNLKSANVDIVEEKPVVKEATSKKTKTKE